AAAHVVGEGHLGRSGGAVHAQRVTVDEGARGPVLLGDVGQGLLVRAGVLEVAVLPRALLPVLGVMADVRERAGAGAPAGAVQGREGGELHGVVAAFPPNPALMRSCSSRSLLSCSAVTEPRCFASPTRFA